MLLQEIDKLPFKVAAPFWFPAAMKENSCCSPFSPAFGLARVPDFSHSNRCLVVYHCCLNWLHLKIYILIHRSRYRCLSNILVLTFSNTYREKYSIRFWHPLHCPLFLFLNFFSYSFLLIPFLVTFFWIKVQYWISSHHPPF